MSNSKHPILYGVWDGMMRRCYNTKHIAYHRYGGRRIFVCKRWHKFDNFKADMLPGYKRGLRLERKDNDGIYKKSNCTWATPREQALNRSSTVYLTIKGKTLCIKDWAKRTNQNYSSIRARVVAGYSHEKCVFGLDKWDNRRNKRVIDNATGIIYPSKGAMAEATGYSFSNLSKILCGERGQGKLNISYLDN